jgi:UDP-2,4-diacetamido-2,4,6-trideoxy-beta-L-altropyranose hydrolase
MTLRIAFRADASLQMGSGHVMRCLTLADALRAKGAQCHFISRAHPGHLIEIIRQRGHMVMSLKAPMPQAQPAIQNASNTVQIRRQNQLHKSDHAAWLGCAWETDAEETTSVLASLHPDWLVVDHYALDRRWEDALAKHYRQLLVFDDLADRPHRCNLLLDQNLGRQPDDYDSLANAHCHILTGPNYALLRPEFAAMRPYSLRRRTTHPALHQLLITMGGIDQPNATGQVLQALKTCALPQSCRISVIMGHTAPWVKNVRELAAQMPWPTEVAVNVNDMAQRMADCDLAIGAAGSTSWERCCLGVPTLMAVLAENQQAGALAMEAAQAARLIGAVSDIATQLPLAAVELIDPGLRSRMSIAASAVTDGRGVEKVLSAMGVTNV